MRVTWNLNHLHLGEQIKSHMDTRIAKLEKRLKSWADDAILMAITFERVGSKEEFRCVLNLSLPQKTLHAEETRPEMKTAFNDCYTDLMRQEKKLMANLRREDRFQDVAKAKRTLPDAPVSEDDEDDWSEEE